MSKKIKISEAQLERLVKSNAKLIKEEEALDEIGVGSVEMGLAKEIAPLIKDKFKEMSVDSSGINIDILTRALAHELNQNSEVDDSTDGMEPEIGELSMGDDGMGHDFSSDELDETLNESVKQYLTEFDRYMKGPKI